jgi:dihydroorotase
MRTLVRGGRCLDPGAGVDRVADLCIADGRIAALGAAPADFTPDTVIDARLGLVVPGLVDLCARFREPGSTHKATIASESVAAAAGGVTSICCPPDTEPVIDTPAVVDLIGARSRACGGVRIHPLGALTQGLNGELLAEMQALKEAGCVGVSNGERPVANSEVLRRALEYARSCDLTVHFRPEDHWLRNGGVAHEGAVSTRLGLPPIPVSAETVALSRALLLAEQSGARLHVSRLSSARALALLAAARRDGLPVTADVSINQLHLTEGDVDGYNTLCHLQPPLRSAADRAALREALAAGVIDAVCSDHQPHDIDAKSAPFAQTEPGASTIELLLPLLLELVEDGVLTLQRALHAVTAAPAAILGIAAGTLRVGAPADIAILDLGAEVRVAAGALRSLGRNTPYHGWTLRGRVTHTLQQGRAVHGA